MKVIIVDDGDPNICLKNVFNFSFCSFVSCSSAARKNNKKVCLLTSSFVFPSPSNNFPDLKRVILKSHFGVIEFFVKCFRLNEGKLEFFSTVSNVVHLKSIKIMENSLFSIVL